MLTFITGAERQIVAKTLNGGTDCSTVSIFAFSVIIRLWTEPCYPAVPKTNFTVSGCVIIKGMWALVAEVQLTPFSRGTLNTLEETVYQIEIQTSLMQMLFYR